jgi:signal transduction histidine kinase
VFFLYCCLSWGIVLSGQDTADRSRLWRAYHQSVTDTARLSILADLAYAYRRNDVDSALLLSRQVMEHSARIGFGRGRAKALTAEGAALLQKAEYEEAIDRLENAITIFASLGEIAGQAKSMNEMGLVYYRLGKFAEATRQFNTAIDLAALNRDFEQVARCWNNLGIVQNRLGNYQQALECYQTSIRIREANGLSPEAATYTSIGNLYNNLGDYEVSLQYYREALPLLQEQGNRIAYAVTLYNIGTVHEAQQLNDSAMIYYRKALDVGHQLGARQINAAVVEAMGNVRKTEEKYEEAEWYYNEVLNILDSIGGDQSQQTVVLLNLAKLRFSQNKWSEAEDFAMSALAIAGENELSQDQEELYELLAELKEKQGNYRSAYQYLKEHRKIRDSLVTAELAEQLTSQRARYEYELEDKNYRLDVMNAQAERDQAVHQSRQYKLWGLGGGFVLISLLLVLLFILNLQRKRTNRRLALKNGELNLKNQQLETSNHKLQQFVFAASHDLRESLRSITSFSQLLRRKIAPDQEDMQHYINYITNGGHRMKKILDDLLSYSRLNLEEDKNELLRTETIISTVLSLLQEEVKAADASIRIEGELPQLRGHRPMLEQLFFNVIENCLKYRQEERPLEVQIRSYMEHDHFCFEIRDNGMGIEEAYLKHIFDPFYRVHDRLLSGSGLGLAICRRIVELYKGKIWATSEPNEGTTIFFCVPEAEVVTLQENEM